MVPKNIIVICGKPKRIVYGINTLQTEVKKAFKLWEFIFSRPYPFTA